MRAGVDEDQAVAKIIDRLRADYRGVVDGEHVAGTVRDVYASFDEQPVRDFVPLLVERQSREALDGETGN